LAKNGYACTTGLPKDLPWNKTVALYFLEADLKVTDAAAKQKTYELNKDPPIMYYSSVPTVLVLIDGKPVLQSAADKLEKVVDTSFLTIYCAGGRGGYYNPVTGNSGYAAHAQNDNAYTGNYSTGSSISGYYPGTGNGYPGEAGTVSNAYTGGYAAGARGMDYNHNTGVVVGGVQ